MGITLVAHDPDWTLQADKLMDHLRQLFASNIQRVDHVGSTAVPLLAAKPKLHIDVIAQDGVLLEQLRDALLPFGYADHGYRFSNNEIQMTRPTASLTQQAPATLTTTSIRSHRICICSADCEAPRARRRFRDALRHSRDLARQYEQLKRRLAEDAEFHGDLDHYTAGKSAFVQAVLSGSRQGLRPA